METLMKTETINLELDVNRLTSEYSESLVLSITSLNSGRLTEEGAALVEKSQRLSEVYKLAIENFLFALEGEPVADEREHRIEFATKMQNLRQREIEILLHHPTYSKNRD